MTEKIEQGNLLLEVKYRHKFTSKDRVHHKFYEMHPQRNVKNKGAGMFSIRNSGDTGRKQYVTDAELAELFAVNGFVELGINLRMLPLEKYEGSGSSPALAPSISDVVSGSTFELFVNEQCSKIRQHGLSRGLHSKLTEIGIGLPYNLLSHDPIGLSSNIATPRTPIEPLKDDQSEQPPDADIDFTSKLEYPLEDIQQRAIKTRRGQPDFRKRVFEAYGNKCAITGCEVLSVLEAAHINPHADGTDWETDNGLPLRADIHTLFDLRLLSLTPDCHIQVSRKLNGSVYEELHGKIIHLPSNRDHYPAPEKLAKHYDGFNKSYFK